MKLSQDQREKLITLAQSVRKNAYAPYSNYSVGSVLLAESGEYYDGVNVENAAYQMAVHHVEHVVRFFQNLETMYLS
jgi:cytidine deaminase